MKVSVTNSSSVSVRVSILGESMVLAPGQVHTIATTEKELGGVLASLKDAGIFHMAKVIGNGKEHKPATKQSEITTSNVTPISKKEDKKDSK